MIRLFKIHVCPNPVIQQRLQVQGDIKPLYSDKLQQ